MKIFCDTNVLVAGSLEDHPHHHSARPVLERVKQGKDTGYIAAHSIAEAYAVLTRLPGGAALDGETAWRLISENILKSFSVIALSGKDYSDALQAAALAGIEGGRTYDALILKAAEKSGADRVLTFNVSHFRGLAPDSVKTKIVAP